MPSIVNKRLNFQLGVCSALSLYLSNAIVTVIHNINNPFFHLITRKYPGTLADPVR